jgi:epoxyqueuosine reductase
LPSLLVHCCCVHCSAYSLKYWRQQGFQVTAFWYNPNIHPYAEHQLRLEAIKTFLNNTGIPLVMSPCYDIDRYFKSTRESESRCESCYQMRLEAAATCAQDNGYDGFTSSLLISPQQQHDRLTRIGIEVADRHKVRFYYADLRKRYSDSRALTKSQTLYRQEYCGCLHSKHQQYPGQTAN